MVLLISPFIRAFNGDYIIKKLIQFASSSFSTELVTIFKRTRGFIERSCIS